MKNPEIDLASMTIKSYLKKASKVLLSFYVFSVFVSNPSLLSFFFSRIDDKNCVFLLCNAILVILAKSSSSDSSSSESAQIRVPEQDTPNSLHPMELVTPNYEAVPELKEEGGSPLMLDTQELIKDVVVIEEEYTAAENDGSMAEEEDEEIESEEEEEEEEEEAEECYVKYEEESMDMYGEEKETEGSKLGMMSIEELNVKFEEFIWKMKEDIRVEAQQQLLNCGLS